MTTAIWIVSCGFYLLVALLMMKVSLNSPVYNWDMIPYTAAAYSINNHNPDEIHSKAYAAVSQSVPASDWNRLIHGNAYQTKMYTNPADFMEQLPFYTIKPLYIAAIYTLHIFGVNMSRATWLISVWSYAVICAVIGLVLFKLKEPVLFVAVAFGLATAPMHEIAVFSTPDAFSAAILTIATSVWLLRGNVLVASTLAVLSILARPDNLLVALGLLTAFAIVDVDGRRLKLKKYLVFVALSIGISVLISQLAHSYGWATLFTQSFVFLLYQPATYHGHITIAQYLSTLTSGLNQLTWTSFFAAACVAIALTFTARFFRENSTMKSIYWLSIVALVSMLAHFILFPSADDRFYVGEYIIIALCAIVATKELRLHVHHTLQKRSIAS